MKKLLSIFLALALFCTLLPTAALAARPAGAAEAPLQRVRLERERTRPATRDGQDPERETYGWYESDDGCVFFTADGSVPEAVREDCLVPRTIIPLAEDATELRLLFDRSQAADVDYNSGEVFFYDREPEGLDELYVIVKLYDGSEWTDIWVVEHGVVAEGYTLENNMLNVSIGDSLYADVYVFWTEACYQYQFFSGTEAYPIVVDLNFWGRGTLELPVFVLPENTMYYKNNVIARVAEDVEELTVSWPEGCRLNYLGGYFGVGREWSEPELPEGNSYTYNIKRYYEDGARMTYNYAEFGFDDWYRDFNGAFSVDPAFYRGTVFWSVGDEMPEISEESIVWNGGDRYSFTDEDGNPQKINLLINADQLLADSYWETGEFVLEDNWVDPADRAVYIVAECARADGSYHEFLAVINGAVVADGFTYENNVLSFTPVSAEEVSFRVFFTEADYTFWYYPPTEECPILIQYSTNNSEALILPPEVSEENRTTNYDGGSGKLRVSADSEALTFTWPQDIAMGEIGLEEFNNDGAWQDMEFEGSSFTLVFDEPFEDGNIRDWYNLDFNFVSYDWVGQDRQLCAWYDRWPGSIFWSVGEETPIADMDHYLNESWDFSVCYTPNGDFEPVHLLLDNTQGINWDIWNESGEVVLEERDPEWDSDGYYADARYVDENGEWFDGTVLYNGEVVQDGWTFENNVLSYTPANDYNIELNVWWRERDYAFDHFYGTEECPVVIHVNWYGWYDEDAVPVPEGISEENYVVDWGRMRIRVPWDTESVTFTWNGDLVNISYADMFEEFTWLDVVPEGDSYTLYLDNTWEDGSPWDYYNIDFNFTDEWNSMFQLDYNSGDFVIYGAIDETPEATAEAAWRGFEAYSYWNDGKPGEINLLIDLNHTIDDDIWNEEGRIEVVDCWHSHDEGYSAYIVGYLTLPNGEWYEGLIVEDGVAVVDGVTFENNLLKFTPQRGERPWIQVFASKAEYEVGTFSGSDETEYPVRVELAVFGHVGEIELPEGVLPENAIVREYCGRSQIRYWVDEELASITLVWPEGAKLEGYDLLDDWADGPHPEPEGNSLTLPLNGGSYYANLWFEDGEHAWGDWTQTVAPTCTEKGEESRTCTICGAVETREVDALGHNYVAAVTEPTCTEAGCTTYTCSRCGDSYVGDETAALGHNFVDGVCTVCGEKDPDYKPPENPFVDVDEEDDWFAAAVLWATTQDPPITNGTDDTHFSPSNKCTRAEIVQFLWNAAGKPEVDTAENPFVDVSEDDWYYKAVMWAVANKITSGTDATHFAPTKRCTRAEVVMFLWNAAGNPAIAEGTNNPFTDVPNDAWYVNAVLWAVANGITSGTTPTTFAPTKVCTRAEVVQFLYKASK